MVLLFLDSVHKLCYKDLPQHVTTELRGRIEAADSDSGRLILQSFGISSDIMLLENVADILNVFPETPVKLLKDVFEALQLYDLVELLEEPANPLSAESLQLAFSLDEIQKLRNTAGRPISCHSRAAVLIFAKDTQDSSVKGIETFFKDLNLNSKVTVIQYRNWSGVTAQMGNRRSPLERTQDEIRWINEQLKTETEREAIIELKSELESKMETLEQVQEGLQELHEEDMNVLRAALMVIKEWIQRQGWCKLSNTFVLRAGARYIVKYISFKFV